SFIRFYLPFIAPDKLTVALLFLGIALILFLPNRRKVWPYLIVGLAFFISKPLDLTWAPHHVALWIPFYAIVCSVPVAVIIELLEPRIGSVRYLTPAVSILIVAILGANLTNGLAAMRSITAAEQERLWNVQRSRDWMAANLHDASGVM